jgi:hypothetical protein
VSTGMRLTKMHWVVAPPPSTCLHYFKKYIT